MRNTLVVALAALLSFPAAAQQYEVPVIDLPYNAAHGVRAPSMQQSLALTADVYDASHVGLEEAFGERKKLGRTAIALFDFLTVSVAPLPLTDAWVHEECIARCWGAAASTASTTSTASSSARARSPSAMSAMRTSLR